MLLLFFCLSVNHVNKPIVVVFGAFLYHFNNTISIFVTIYIFLVVVVVEYIKGHLLNRSIRMPLAGILIDPF